MVRQLNYLNLTELRALWATRIDPLICVQLEADFSQNVEFNCFRQTVALKPRDVKKVLIREVARGV